MTDEDHQTDTTKLKNLLDDERKQAGQATGLLSRMWRLLLSDLNMTPMRYGKYMDRYLQDPRNRVGASKRERTSTRGNLNRELLKSNMTWSNIVKGIYFVNPVRARLRIDLEFERGNKTSHQFLFINRGPKRDVDVERASYESDEYWQTNNTSYERSKDKGSG